LNDEKEYPSCNTLKPKHDEAIPKIIQLNTHSFRKLIGIGIYEITKFYTNNNENIYPKEKE
jgi:hypothetical protein